MNKTNLIGTVAGGLVVFILSYLFYGLSGVLDGHTTEAGNAVMRGEDTNIPLIFVGHLIQAYILCLLYSKWARGTHNFGHGFQFGALVGVFLGLGLNLIWFATSNSMSLTGHIIDGVFQIVALGITGGVISMVYDRFAESE